MALLFVPLTTLAIQDLKGKEIGQGTGLTNMMRQLGGSFEIALLTTLIHMRQDFKRNVLLKNITEYNPAFVQRLKDMMQTFIAKGYSILNAKKAAYRAREGNEMKQTMLLSYKDAYWNSGMIMLCSVALPAKI